MNNFRLRYAPSPTGYLHIGGARTALFCYLYAKHNSGDFIVRIEDTDIERNVVGGIDSQLNNLRWLGIKIDETVDTPNQKFGPYIQTERLQIYQKYAEELIASGHAYECFCTQAEIDAERDQAEKDGRIYNYSKRCSHISINDRKNKRDGQNYSIRLKIPHSHEYTWNDMVRGKITVNATDVPDYVIMKSNGIPTYNFAVVVDDHLMEISHVVRGEEHISNTPKQMAIYEAFKWNQPLFAHLTIITNETGKKLSKRDTTMKQFIEDYKNEGYIPEAIFNFLSLLGWNPADNVEIMSHDEIISKFSSERWGKSPSMFDVKKMQWISNQYFKKLNRQEVIDLVKPFIEKSYDTKNKSITWIEELILTYQPQLTHAQEIIHLVKNWFHDEIHLTEEMHSIVNTESSKKVLHTLKTKLEHLQDWTSEAINQSIKQIQIDTGIKGKDLFMPIRIKATGHLHGPELAKTIYLTGKEKVIKRLG